MAMTLDAWAGTPFRGQGTPKILAISKAAVSSSWS
jgi:hypothetical protein